MTNLLTHARDALSNLLLGGGPEGTTLSLGLAATGTVLIAYIGGWDRMVQALIIFMALDVLFGLLQAARNKSLDSHVMFWGGVNKLLVLCMVGVGVQLDGLVALEEPYIRTAVIWFYIGREGLSILENYAKFDPKNKLPAVVTDVLEQLHNKGDQGGKR